MGACCLRHAVAELPGLSNRYEDTAGPPPDKDSATGSPLNGKSLAKEKRNCCNSSQEAGWLLRRPSLWQALCCGCGRCEFASHTREVDSGSCSSHEEEAWTEIKTLQQPLWASCSEPSSPLP